MARGDVAPGEKKAHDQGWSIVLMDESGFMLQPVVRRTWAPKRETPIQYSWGRHARLSTIAAIALSPQRRRLGLYFQVYDHNITSLEVMRFLWWTHRHLRRKLIVVMDRYSVHRKAVRLLQEAGVEWLEVVWLPSYAPELNPVEMVWNHTKYADLANFLPEDIHDLQQAVTASLERTGGEGHLLRSCFRYAGLAL